MVAAAAVLPIIDKGAAIALKYLEKKDRQEDRKYIEDFKSSQLDVVEASAKLEEHLRLPLDKQYDNVVEDYRAKIKNYEAKRDVLQDIVLKDLERRGDQ